MFYSHTFLARKGPLGTVWCAAHLQHKLKKSHYVSTNVPSTVERIMFPEVPIALRMSGHLLLGVVRIYSKQVDYLYEDCNEIRITINRVFTTVSIVNLPKDATHATFQSVTLPENFNLDSLELDDYHNDLSEDSHLRRQEDITLTEQIPTGRDPYIVIRFDEDDLRASASIENNSRSGPTPMDEDVPPPADSDAPDDFEIHSPRNNDQFGGDDINVGDGTPINLSSVELRRDTTRLGYDFNNSPILPDRAEPDTFLEEQISRDKETSATTPVISETVVPDDCNPLSENHEEQHSAVQLGSPTPFVHQSADMELQPTPPVEQQPKVRRKRKQSFDEFTVLSNEYVKNLLKDTSDILRREKKCPLSHLDIWKLNKRLRIRKEDVFCDPFITGSCADLQSIHKNDSVPAKFHLLTTEETNNGTSDAQPQSDAQPPLPRGDSDMEIENLRNNEFPSPEPDRFMRSPSNVVPSPYGREYLSPLNSNTGSPSKRMEYTEGVGTSDNFFSEMDTSDRHTVLSDIPELVPSAGELGFLEQDGNSPNGSQGTPEFGMFSKNQGTPELQQLSSRTRALAQYLKRQSSATPIPGNNSNEPPEDLSLSKILEGKPKKICARMFYETLVLKNFGLVDVNQENPYDDIILKITPKLSKGKFPP